MSNRNLAEFLLARAVGPTRASAICGDLLELAATRGRLWYWTAYIRTLVTFTWRGVLAFLVALVTFSVLYRMNTMVLHPGSGGALLCRAVLPHPYVRTAIGYVTYQLWFLVPSAMVRYGVRDRFVQLGLAFALLASCAFYCIALPVLPLALAALALLTLAAFATSARWRGQAVALAAAIAVGITIYFNLEYLAHLGCWMYEHKPLNATSHYGYFETGYAFPYTLFWTVTWTISLLTMLALSLVSSQLHRFFSRASLATPS